MIGSGDRAPAGDGGGIDGERAETDRAGAITCTDLSGGSNAVVDVTGSFHAQG
jgi:hypothetical protein